jgi:hypothetical protein
VIVTLKMKDPMDNEKKDLLQRFFPETLRLPSTRRTRDDHIPQEEAVFPRLPHLPEGKGEHIRRPVDAPKFSVQAPDGCVADEGNIKIGMGDRQFSEDSCDRFANCPKRNFDARLSIF